jgi:hypothetical protein
MMNKLKTIIAILLMQVVLAACRLPAPVSPTPPDQAAAYTAAAETIIANLTVVAQTLTPTISGGQIEETPQATVPSETSLPTATEAQPNATNTTTPSASPTSPPTATPTLPSSDPRAGLGDPTFLDTFSDGGNWPLYDDGHVSFAVNNDRLVMTAFDPNLWEGFILSWPQVSDFYLEMTASPRKCSGGDRYGLIARGTAVESGSYSAYNFSVTCDGRYALRLWDNETSKFVVLVDWTQNEAIKGGSNQTNRIGLMADGERLSMYANGNLLRDFVDDTYLSGRIGVVIGSANTNNLKVDIDEFAYWDMP